MQYPTNVQLWMCVIMYVSCYFSCFYFLQGGYVFTCTCLSVCFSVDRLIKTLRNFMEWSDIIQGPINRFWLTLIQGQGHWRSKGRNRFSLRDDDVIVLLLSRLCITLMLWLQLWSVYFSGFLFWGCHGQVGGTRFQVGMTVDIIPVLCT